MGDTFGNGFRFHSTRSASPSHIPVGVLEAVTALLERARTGPKPRDEWKGLFAEVDACFVPVLSVEEAVVHSDCHCEVLTSDGQTARQPAGSLQACFPPSEPGPAAPPPGVHTRVILAEFGYSQDEAQAVLESGLVLAS